MASTRNSSVDGWTWMSMALTVVSDQRAYTADDRTERCSFARAGGRQLSGVVTLVAVPEAVVAVAGLVQRVGAEGGELLGLLELIDERLVEVVGVEVVHDEAALVAEPAEVLEVPGPGHGLRP